MQPEPDAMLELIAKKISTQIIPVVDDYLKGDLHMLVLLIRAAAERFEVEVDVFVREHDSMHAIFEKARAIPALSPFVPVAEEKVVGFRLSDLRARNHRELEQLTALHAELFDMADCGPALGAAIETFLAERVVLHSIVAGPYPTDGLAERQRFAMRTTPSS